MTKEEMIKKFLKEFEVECDHAFKIGWDYGGLVTELKIIYKNECVFKCDINEIIRDKKLLRKWFINWFKRGYKKEKFGGCTKCDLIHKIEKLVG